MTRRSHTRRPRFRHFVAVLVGLTVFAGLVTVATSSRLDDFAPTMLVTSGPGVITIHIAAGTTNRAVGKLEVYVPTGLTPSLGAAAGSTLGTATAQVLAADTGGNTVDLTGSVIARAETDSTDAGGVSVPLATAAASCTGTATHTAFWELVFNGAGQAFEVPVFVDAVPADSPDAAYASATLQICLPPGDVSVGTPGRAPLGAKVIDATLSLHDVVPTARGEFRWRLTATPYGSSTGVIDLPATIEAQSLLREPATISFVARGIKGKARARISGYVTEGGKPVAGAVVRIICQAVLATVRTDRAGRFHATVGVGTPTDTLFARTSVAQRELGASGCTPTFSAQAMPCISATVGGFALRSRKVLVRT